jgi:hypothetical protein
MTAFAVTWKRKPLAHPFLIDVDSMEMAAEISIRLQDVPKVYDVAITELPEAEMDGETRAKIWQRIADRLNYDWATGVMTA